MPGPTPETDAGRPPEPPGEQDIRAQLHRVLESPDFASAARASRFLQFLVEEALAQRSEQLTEYAIALGVFDRDESFNPATNPIVRVEASRLRRRLEHYFLTQGRDDPVLIEVPRGTYVPRFGANRDVLHLEEELAALPGDEPERLRLQLPRGPVVAVLPFESLDGEADRAFVDGITVEIITALSRFREFYVLGRYTTFGHRDDEDAVRVGRQLGARYVLEGSARRQRDHVRVNAQLVSAADGKVIWAESYSRDLSVPTIFDIQHDIASHVVASIAQPHGAIARPELTVTRRKPTESLDTYDCILMFYEYAAKPTPGGHADVRAALGRAVERDPDCSNAWAALSQINSDSFRFGFNVEEGRKEALTKGLEAAQRAIKLDPENPMAYHALFQVRFAQGDLAAFRTAGDRAVTLNPNNTEILADYGLSLMMSKDSARGRLFLKVAMVLNPDPPDWYHIPFFYDAYFNGDYDTAFDAALRVQNADFFWTHGIHALAYHSLQMEQDARAALGRLLKLYPDFAQKAPRELGLWMDAEEARRVVDVLRQVGLPAVEDPDA